MATKEKRKVVSVTHHICIPIDVAIEMIKKGKNPLTGTPTEALNELLKHRAEGKTYFTGCSREDRDGTCKGHPNYEKK